MTTATAAAPVSDVFTAEELARARRYHRPKYVALLAGITLDLTVLALLAFSSAGDRLYGGLAGLPWWARALVFPALVVLVSTLVRLPLAFWSGYVHEKRWDFSTQNVRGWLADRAKGLAVSAAIASVTLFGLVALARALPDAWPLAAALAAAGLVLLLSFLAPLVLEPVFNRFEPLADEDLAAELRALADEAGVPVREVLVADASRRTRKENAYVSGLGSTRRVVLYDTLVARNDRGYARLVVAHELGHRRKRHVAKATLIGMAGVAAAVVLLWATLQIEPLLRATGASGAGDPRIAPFVLLFGSVLELLAAPFQAALSRRWERDADRFSLELTGDAELFESAHRSLATSNLADLAPPRALYLLFFSHPTPRERIAQARAWARP